MTFLYLIDYRATGWTIVRLPSWSRGGVLERTNDLGEEWA